MRTRVVTIAAAVAGTAITVWQVRGRRRRRALGWSLSSATSQDAGLHVRRLGDSGPVVLLLHGLAASGGYWGAAYDGLGAASRLVIPDLLGFGASPRPPHGYGPDEHVDAILDCLDQLGLGGEPLIIGAHSLGVLVALRLAARRPEVVLGVAGFGPPVYPDCSAASKHLSRLGVMAQLSTVDEQVAHALCLWVCAHRRTAAVLARVLVPELSGPIAAAGVDHSWPSFSETLERVILTGEAEPGLMGSPPQSSSWSAPAIERWTSPTSRSWRAVTPMWTSGSGPRLATTYLSRDPPKRWTCSSHSSTPTTGRRSRR